MAVKLYKRKKEEEAAPEEDVTAMPVYSSREPFMFKETIKFFRDEYD